MKIIKIDPYFSEKIWDSKNWKNLGFKNINGKNIGEAWVISAHQNGLSYLNKENILH